MPRDAPSALSAEAHVLLRHLDKIGPEDLSAADLKGEVVAELEAFGYAKQGRYGPFPTLCITDTGREALRR